MKKNLFSCLLAISCSLFSFSQQLGMYEFTSTGPACSDENTSVNMQPSNANFSSFTTTGTFCSNLFSNAFEKHGWEVGTQINLNQYNEFTITAHPGYQFDLDSMIFDHATLQFAKWRVRISLDNFSSTIFSGQSNDIWKTSRNGFNNYSHLTSITIRFYVVEIVNATQTWSQDDVEIKGTLYPLDTTIWYADADCDGFGDPNSFEIGTSSSLPNATHMAYDCNDNDDLINPHATEMCDLIDNDCDGLIDEGLIGYFYVDMDNDGFGVGDPIPFCDDPGVNYTFVDILDCDDNNPEINPGFDEICDGIDNNCDGNIDEGLQTMPYFMDNDGDGYGAGQSTEFCAYPGLPYSQVGNDCDDNNPSIHPGNLELCDGLDNNCSGTSDEGFIFTTYFTDADGDGFGVGAGSQYCENPGANFSMNNGDCNDADNTIHPGATEIPNNGIDEDCTGSDYSTIGLAETTLQQINLFPNPVNKLLSIESALEISSIQIYTADMKLVHSRMTETTNNLNIDTGNLASGLYYLEISFQNQAVSTYKFVKM